MSQVIVSDRDFIGQMPPLSADVGTFYVFHKSDDTGLPWKVAKIVASGGSCVIAAFWMKLDAMDWANKEAQKS